MTYLAYTGIGSRGTPEIIFDKITAMAKILSSKGWVLRSGAATGADTAFEKGVDKNELKEIYVPWRGFANRTWREGRDIVGGHPQAFEIAKRIHPAWFQLKETGMKLHARNIHQVLGRDLNTPSKFVICWTIGGRLVGGTRTAITIAQDYKIPVYNLGVLHTSKIDPEQYIENILSSLKD